MGYFNDWVKENVPSQEFNVAELTRLRAALAQEEARVRDLEELIGPMREEIEALEKDAARYQWLRNVAPNMFWYTHDQEIGLVKFDTHARLWKPEAFDRAIDSAMEAGK